MRRSELLYEQKEQREEILDLTGLMCPLPIVITSEKMRRLKEGQILRVVSTDPGFEKDIYNWCQQSGNRLLELRREDGKVIAVLQKSLQAVEPSLIYWIKFHALGVKLHIRHFLMMLNPFSAKPDHFITFSALSEGIKAEKMLKGEAKLIPIPDEIDPHCGVVMAVKGEKKAKDIFQRLQEEGVAVEAIYKKEGKNYTRVYP
ncbi:sulfurtransferase TusA family protein [Thermocrinis minervae]|uniref:TusA-related sulfurtransferase n=1 Tax=Thermocrinis minervae TaxID=381751 RepID=A0A1M6SGA9_9AQUI|nr:sulfurtransferase TusA family protein [Thermocrinis minervae]SHK43781.1 TusA-related sulfurtransferase [Thermocrinis minervae]